jgi:23S rRNA-/tRNA-specific pseudouridylate synthase
MKHTAPLKVKRIEEIEEQNLVIHPNDGYDLGLMSRYYDIQLHSNITAEEFNQTPAAEVNAKIELANECHLGTVEMSLSFWEHLGEPEEVFLIYDNNKLLVLNKPKE